MNKITQINISSHEENNFEKKISDFVFLDPLNPYCRFKKKEKKGENKSFFISHTLFHKGKRKIQQIFLKNISFFAKKINKEGKFRTIIALFLSQDRLRSYYLTDTLKRVRFIESVKRAATEAGLEKFTIPFCDSAEELIDQLTWIEKIQKSLIKEKKLLHRYTLLMSKREKEYLLFLLLKELDRIPLTSVVEIIQQDKCAISFSMTTYHGKTSLSEIELPKIECDKKEYVSKPFLQFHVHNVSNQHLIFDSTDRDKKLLCSVCGNLESSKKVLEQLLFLIHYDPSHPLLIQKEKEESSQKLLVCFTSFYCWHELDLIIAQKNAVSNLNGKTLHFKNQEGEICNLSLSLFNYNIPLSNWYEPKESKATLNDLNDETLIQLAFLFCKKQGIPCQEGALAQIQELFAERDSLVIADKKELFFQQKKITLHAIDQFRNYISSFIKVLKANKSYEAIALIELLQRQKHQNHEIDQLLYLNTLLQDVKVIHNYNSNRLPKLLSSQSITKAQSGYHKVYEKPFIPPIANKEERKLFELLYSNYLTLDESHIHAALSGGYLEEKQLFKEFFKNKQISLYLN